MVMVGAPLLGCLAIYADKIHTEIFLNNSEKLSNAQEDN